MMKKTVLAILAMFSSLAFARPFSVSFFTPERPKISLVQSFEYNFLYTAKYENSGYATLASVDARELLFKGGFYANTKSTDIALQAYYAPCFWHLVSFGVSAKYHYNKFCDSGIDMFCEHNILPGAFISFNIKDIWKIYVNSGALIKFSIINAWPSNIRVTDNTVFLNSGCIFQPTDRLRFSFDVGNYSFFEDTIIGNVQFNLAARYRLFEYITAGAEVYCKWVDEAVPQDSFAQAGVRMNWGVLF